VSPQLLAMSGFDDAEAMSPPPSSGAAVPPLVLEEALAEVCAGLDALDPSTSQENKSPAASASGSSPLPVPTASAEPAIPAEPSVPSPAPAAPTLARGASPKPVASRELATPRRKSVGKREIGLIYSSLVRVGGMNVSPTQGVRRLARRLRGGAEDVAPLPLQDCLQLVPIAQAVVAPEVARARERAARAQRLLAARPKPSVVEKVEGCAAPAGPAVEHGPSKDDSAVEVGTAPAEGTSEEPETAAAAAEPAEAVGPRRRAVRKAVRVEAETEATSTELEATHAEGTSEEPETAVAAAEPAEAVGPRRRAVRKAVRVEAETEATSTELEATHAEVATMATELPEAPSSGASKKRGRSRKVETKAKREADAEALVGEGSSSSSASSSRLQAPEEAPADESIEVAEEPPRQVKKTRAFKQVEHLLSLKAREREKYLRGLNPAQQMRLAVALSLAEGGA